MGTLPIFSDRVYVKSVVIKKLILEVRASEERGYRYIWSINMAGVGADGPAPGAKDDAPDLGVTIVHKVKSKLGYTEIHTPAPPMDDKGQVK